MLDDEIGPEIVTAWDRRVVRSLEIADTAHAGVRILRGIAVLSAAAAVLGTWLYVYGQEDFDSGDFDFRLPDRVLLGQFLSNVATPLASSGLVLGLTFLLAVHAARLDLEIVLADREESGRSTPDEPA